MGTTAIRESDGVVGEDVAEAHARDSRPAHALSHGDHKKATIAVSLEPVTRARSSTGAEATLPTLDIANPAEATERQMDGRDRDIRERTARLSRQYPV
jgi:hypothetical protein